MSKPKDLTPQFPIIPAEIEVVATNTQVQNLSDFVGGQSINSPVVVSQNQIESANFVSGSTGWQITANGDVEFNSGTFRGTLNIGGTVITIDNTEDIQTNIDTISNAGGGTLYLSPGTYSVSSDITLYSNVSISGTSASKSIIDFQSTASQMLIEGSGGYSIGTVSITNNSTTVTGTGTSWSTNVSPGQYIMLDGIWYPIAAVSSNTSITIALPYAGVDLSGATYVSATRIDDVKIKDLTIKNSTLAAIKLRYGSEFFVSDVDFQSCAQGLDIDDSSQISLKEVDFTANNVGITVDNSHYMEWNACGVIDSLAGVGMSFTNVTNAVYSSMFILNSAGNGVSITDCSNLTFDGASVENGGHGIELVSGNSNIVLQNIAAENNSSDGIKFSGTSDKSFLSNSSLANNGGYGLNIAASTCDDNIVTGNSFANNTTADINDNGTGTIIAHNTPESVNKYDFGDATSLEIPNSATPTVDVAGEIAVDTSITDYTGLIKYHDGNEELTVVAMPTANLSTTDGDVVKYNATNNEFEMGSVTPTQILKSYTAGEDITSKDAVYISDAGVSSLALESSDGSAPVTASVSQSVAGGAGSNRMAILLVSFDSTSPTSLPTYGGDSFTLLQNTSTIYSYSLVAPASGSNTLSIPFTTGSGKSVSWAIYFFSGATQSNPSQYQNANVTYSGTSTSYAITPTNPGSFIVAGFTVDSLFSLTASTNMNDSYGGNSGSPNFHSARFGQSGVQNDDPTVSVTQTVTHSDPGAASPTGGKAQIVVDPISFTSPTILRCDASVASTADGFIGFADAAITSGSTGNVVIAGEVTGLSGLTTGSQYYLSDTTGAISTTAGTVTRKVGIATSATTLNITNIW